MAAPFFEQPILNNPYDSPRLHHALDEQAGPSIYRRLAAQETIGPRRRQDSFG